MPVGQKILQKIIRPDGSIWWMHYLMGVKEMSYRRQKQWDEDRDDIIQIPGVGISETQDEKWFEMAHPHNQ